MKQLFTFVLAVIAFAACTQNEVEELTANRVDAPETLTVGFEGGDTRIELNEALKTVWTEGDEVSVFYRSDINQRWQYQGETGERVGDLRRVDAGSGTPTKTTKVVIAYPYDEAYYLNSESCNLQAMLPAVQSYKAGSYGEGGNIMVSQSEYNQFSLKSVVGWLRVELTGEGQMVESITLRGNAGEQVAGELYINTATAEATLASERGEAGEGAGGSLIFDDTMSMEVTLDCGEGVELGSEATEFYIALPPQTFTEGLTIEVNCAGYKPMTLSTESSITIERNHIVPMEAVEHDAGVILPSNELWYTATAKVEPKSSAFNVSIVSNEWDEATGEGVITFDGELTTIGDEAFDGCTSLTSVTIPDSVTTIGDWTFSYCRSLTNVTIPDSVTTIGDGVFAYCNSLVEFKGKFAEDGGRCLIIDGVLNAFALGCGVTEYTIPDSVTTIGENAFSACNSLTSVTIPDSVTTIGDEAFWNCESLISVTIPDSVTTIGEYTFGNCESLTSVTIGDSVTTIGEAAFFNCDSLTSVTIGDSVTTIGDYAFYECSSLTSVTIPDSVTTIGSEAFRYCRSLTSVTIPDSVTTIGDYAFHYCSRLSSVTIGDSVTTIGEAAFGGCSNLAEFKGKFAADGSRCLIKDNTLIAYANASGTTYTIPDSVTTIGEYAFDGCYSLTSVTIPDSVTTIGDMAFAYCESLTSVYCEATTPPTLDDGAFYNNASGRKIYVPVESVEAYKAAENWSEYADHIVEYDYNSTMTLSYTTSDGMPANASGLIISNSYQNGVGELIYIGKDIIPAVLFRNCHNLTSVTIPDNVTTIGDWVFSECYSLTSVTIPDSVTTIGDSAFGWCYSLTSVTIPDSVTTIGGWAFLGCDSLTSVTIGDSVTTIGDRAFYGCDSLTSVYCEATTPPTLGDSTVFDDNASGRKIYVPTESVEAYKAATNWSEYADYIVGYNFE